jgi:ligand-binding sensor domain-containing protein
MNSISKILILLFIVFDFVLKAQNPSASQISDEKGLPSNTIYCILQDKNGFIWLGTDNGLYRYDGRNFKAYKNKFQKSNSLTGLVLDSKNNLYCYNFNGQIFYVENDQLKSFNHWNNQRISSLDCDQNNNIWICNENGIAVYLSNKKKWKHIAHPKNQQSSYFTNSGSWNRYDKNFWCISPKGIMKVNLSNSRTYPIKWIDNKVSGEFLLASNTQSKWVFSQLGGDIFKLINGKFKPFFSKNLNPLLKNRKINKIEGDQKHNIWIYTYTGIIIYNQEKDYAEIIFDNHAFSGGIQDIEKTTWLSTLYDGLFKIPMLEYKTWEIINEKGVRSKPNKLVLGNNSTFFATSDGKVGTIKNSNSKFKYHSLNSSIDIQCLATSLDKKKVFLNNQNTIEIYNSNSLKKLPLQISSPKNIIETKDYLLICSSRGAYCYYYKNNKLDTISTIWTREMYLSNNPKKLYLATNEGVSVYLFKNNKWIFNTTLLKHLQIISLSYNFEKSSLNLLSFNGCIYQLNNDHLPSKIAELPNDILANQIKTSDNKIYISTNKGLLIYNLISNKIEKINRLNGLISDHLNSLDINNNEIWMSSSKGIMCIPKILKHNKAILKLFLKNISDNNNTLFPNKFLDLEYDQGFYVNYDAITLSAENQYKIAYRINSNNWIYITSKDDKIYFNALEPGSFHLEIKLVNNNGIDSVNSIKINGYVQPPFWQRWWFYLSIGLLSVLITFIFFKIRIKKIRLKQEIVIEKMQLKHELKLSQETAIRAQMNPHFIFNVLNSIKTYIYENDKKMAINYLNDFSELVRKILTQSSNTFTKLEDEIELLKLYIELEGMLFENDFSYDIILNNKIEPNNIYIPNLIIQPYIENAFKHGLSHKSGPKKLKLLFEFDKEDQSILIVNIEDNGIGREKSNEINSLNIFKHKSFSTQAIDRVIKLNENQPGIINVLYSDLYIDGNAAGTNVQIIIKLNEENKNSYNR